MNAIRVMLPFAPVVCNGNPDYLPQEEASRCMVALLISRTANADCEYALTKTSRHYTVNIDAAFSQSRPAIVPTYCRTVLVSLIKPVISL